MLKMKKKNDVAKMSFFNNAVNKVKNLFIEDEVITEKQEIKKDIIKVEIPAPDERKIQSVKIETPIEPRKDVSPIESKIDEVPKVEPKRELKQSSSSLFFNDDDFDTLERPKTREKVKEKTRATDEPKRNTKEKKELYSGSIKKVEIESPKIFKPTPIISPVYGILDKNYNKDDIVSKKEKKQKTYIKGADEISIESIRNKAFGTLEDDLFNVSEVPEVEPEVIKKDENLLEDDIFRDLDLNDNTGLDNEDDLSFTNILDSIDENLIDVDDNIIEQELSRNYDNEVKTENIDESKEEDFDDLDLNESDLFNLIDSMYEKRDDE